jgi:hypothetical protein
MSPTPAVVAGDAEDSEDVPRMSIRDVERPQPGPVPNIRPDPGPDILALVTWLQILNIFAVTTVPNIK